MWVALVAVAYAVFFGAAALAKLDSWGSWSATAATWLPLPFRSRIFLVAFPLAELAVVVTLVTSPRDGLAASAGLLAAFGVGVLALLPTSAGKSCGCFGAGNSGQLGLGLALRNFFLAGVALAAFWLGHPTGPFPIAGLTMVALAAVLVLIWVEYRKLERMARQQPSTRAEREVYE
jgi:hypothetical protein